MKKLSSNMTWFMKYVFSALWISGFGIFTAMMFFSESLGNSMEDIKSSKWLFLMMFAICSSCIYWGLARLKKVSLDGNEFVISNFTKEIRVNINEVEIVTGSLFLSPELVWLHLKTSSEFGKKIQFMPPQRFFNLGFSRHPMVKELNELLR